MGKMKGGIVGGVETSDSELGRGPSGIVSTF
jgi:hypothetical protein